MPQPNPHSGTPFLLQLANELVIVIFLHLETADVFRCAQVCRTLNRLGVQHILDGYQVWNPSRHATLIMRPRALVDALSALLISVHIKTFDYVFCDMTLLTTSWDLVLSLTRLTRLIDKRPPGSLNQVLLWFRDSDGSLTEKAPSEKLLKQLCKAFEDLLNTLVAKSCRKFQFKGSTGLLANHYQFRNTRSRRRASWQASTHIIGDVKQYFARHKEDHQLDKAVAEEESRYFRNSLMASRIAIRASSRALLSSRLVHFVAGTVDLFRPPFSQWTFPILQHSQITLFGINFRNLPNDKEETQLILHRLAAAIPKVTSFAIEKMPCSTAQTILSWLKSLPLLESLAITSLPDCAVPTQLQLEHPNLNLIDAAPQIISSILEASGYTPRLPKLKNCSIYINATLANGAKPDDFELAALSEAIAKARAAAGVNRRLSFEVSIKFDHHYFSRIAAPACTGPGKQIRCTFVGPPRRRSSSEVHLLAIVLPITADEIHGGAYNKNILQCLTIFPCLKYLNLYPNRGTVGPSNSPGKLDPFQLQRFQAFCPTLSRVNVW